MKSGSILGIVQFVISSPKSPFARFVRMSSTDSQMHWLMSYESWSVWEINTLLVSLSVIWIKCNLWCVLKLLTSSDLEHRRMTFAIGLRNQFVCFNLKLSDCTINLRSFELASENVNSMTNRILIIVILFWKNFGAILEAVWKIDTISWGSRVVLSSRELSKTFAYFTQLTL